jgi:hypothetical protein
MISTRFQYNYGMGFFFGTESELKQIGWIRWKIHYPLTVIRLQLLFVEIP